MTTISGASEIYRKLSSQIAQSFPEHIREDGPKFVEFIKAYFEYLEQTQKGGDANRGLYDYMDIDRTLDDFVEYFHREFLVNIPRSVAADKRLLTKYIRDYYRSRGSEESCKFLFRALFDEEIDFYYPGDDILRTSDGRWVKETTIRGTLITGNPDDIDGRQVTGATSGATARVQEILSIIASGITIIQLTVENVSGTFVEDEIVSDGFGNSIRIFNAVGSISGVNPIDGGALHQTGDLVTLTGSGGGTAQGIITATTDTSAVTFRIQNGGSGFRKANTAITISGGSPDIPAQISILNLSNTSVITLNSNIINPVKNVVLNTKPFGAGPAAFAASNVNSTLNSALTFSNQTIGSINTIALLTPGSGYTGELPTVDLLDAEVLAQSIVDTERGGYKGHNAQLIASRLAGAIAAISITSSDANFLKNDAIMITNNSRSSANVTVTNVDTYGSIVRGLRRKGLFPATVTADIKGTFSLPGRYIDTKGFLSWNNKLQDNEYYQEFSYVIRAHKLFDDYAQIIKKLDHPAGTRMFGTYRIDSGADLSSNFDVASSIIVYKRAANTSATYANNVVKINAAGLKTVQSTKKSTWFANGAMRANTGAISVGGRGTNVIIISVSNTNVSNGMYQINAISSGSLFTLRQKYEHGAITNGQFYYHKSYQGSV